MPPADEIVLLVDERGELGQQLVLAASSRGLEPPLNLKAIQARVLCETDLSVSLKAHLHDRLGNATTNSQLFPSSWNSEALHQEGLH